MTSYEGLFLTTRRFDEGAAVLRRAAATVSEGMLANTADTGTLEYNTADGTLWFIHALGRHVAVTGDDALAAELAPTLAEIVSCHLDGTRFGIGVDAGGRSALPGRRRLGADLDGRPHRRRARDPPARQGGRGQRALDRGAQPRREARPQRRVDVARGNCGELILAAASPAPTGSACSTWSTGPSGDDASVRPNQLLAVSLPTGRSRASPSSRGAWSTRAAPRC